MLRLLIFQSTQKMKLMRQLKIVPLNAYHGQRTASPEKKHALLGGGIKMAQDYGREITKKRG